MKKITFIKGSFLFMFTLLVFGTSYAQQRTCGMEAHMAKKLADPQYAKQHAKEVARTQAKIYEIQAQKANGTYKKATLIVPVAVHFPEGNEADRACLEAFAQTQIDVINADYTATNADQSQWAAASAFYPGITPGAADVVFCIATLNHPTNSDQDLVEGGPAVTIGFPFGNGDTDSKWAGYMNFVVRDIGAGLLGYSPYPGSISSGDSVVMNTNAYGTGAGCSGYTPSTTYNLGRTVTHELGHFYNLGHTFIVDGGTSCAPADGDGIADTPKVAGSSYGCPAAGSVASCETLPALTMSYMDYVNDACMYMFSAGQIVVAEARLAVISSDFKQNVTQCNSSFTLTATNSPVAVCAPTDGVFNVDFDATGGYSDNTTFTATAGVPANASVSFSPTSLSADGTFTMTVGNIAAVAAGNYTITITGTGTVTNTVDVVLSVENGAPSATTLATPANGTTGTGTSVDLSWSSVANAATYTVQMATDAGFTANVTTNSANTNTYTVTGLTPSTQYFWRVKSVNGCGESAYSSTYNFTTAAIACNTYNSTENNITIPGTGSTAHVITSTRNVTDELNITDVNVTINVQHVWAGDVELKLTSPNGTEVMLLANSKCDDGTADIAVTYDDQASGPVVCSNVAPAVGGTIQPESPLSPFNGENSLGNWVLTATDGYPSADGGEFLNFTLDICGTPVVLGVEDQMITESFNLWPNPSNGEFNISFNASESNDVNLELYDIRGRLISTKTFENNSNTFNEAVNFNNVDPAVYILKIKTGNNDFYRRVIIK
jgi:subtilisin-like proprotein convertase family protein